jgi:hypothetical protein
MSEHEQAESVAASCSAQEKRRTRPPPPCGGPSINSVYKSVKIDERVL